MRDYETIHVLYSNYDTPASYGFLKYYFSTTTGIYNAVKVGVSIIILVLGLVALLIVLSSDGKAQAAPGQTQDAPDWHRLTPGSIRRMTYPPTKKSAVWRIF